MWCQRGDRCGFSGWALRLCLLLLLRLRIRSDESPAAQAQSYNLANPLAAWCDNVNSFSSLFRSCLTIYNVCLPYGYVVKLWWFEWLRGGGDWSPHGAEAKKQNDDQDMSEILLKCLYLFTCMLLFCLCLVIMFLETFAIISVKHMLIIQDFEISLRNLLKWENVISAAGSHSSVCILFYVQHSGREPELKNN